MPDFEYDYRDYLENIKTYNEDIITELQKIQQKQQIIISGDIIEQQKLDNITNVETIIAISCIWYIIYHFIERMLKC